MGLGSVYDSLSAYLGHHDVYAEQSSHGTATFASFVAGHHSSNTAKTSSDDVHSAIEEHAVLGKGDDTDKLSLDDISSKRADDGTDKMVIAHTIDSQKPHEDCATHPEQGCSCAERYRCVTKDIDKNGKPTYVFGCPVPDTDPDPMYPRKFDLSVASYNKSLCKQYFGSEDACMCVPNTEYKQGSDTEVVHLPNGNKVDVSTRYPFLDMSEEAKTALITGGPMTRPPKKLLLSREEWIKEWNGTKNVHGMLQDVMDDMHKDIISTTTKLDSWEHSFANTCPPCPCQHLSDAHGGEGVVGSSAAELQSSEFKDDKGLADNVSLWQGMSEQERQSEMEKSIAEVQMIGNRFKTFQDICNQMQGTETKLVPPDELAKHPPINCYLDENEKRRLVQMWKELGDVTAKLATAGAPLEPCSLGSLLSLSGRANFASRDRTQRPYVQVPRSVLWRQAAAFF